MNEMEWRVYLGELANKPYCSSSSKQLKHFKESLLVFSDYLEDNGKTLEAVWARGQWKLKWGAVVEGYVWTVDFQILKDFILDEKWRILKNNDWVLWFEPNSLFCYFCTPISYYNYNSGILKSITRNQLWFYNFPKYYSSHYNNNFVSVDMLNLIYVDGDYNVGINKAPELSKT